MNYASRMPCIKWTLGSSHYIVQMTVPVYRGFSSMSEGKMKNKISWPSGVGGKKNEKWGKWQIFSKNDHF